MFEAAGCLRTVAGVIAVVLSTSAGLAAQERVDSPPPTPALGSAVVESAILQSAIVRPVELRAAVPRRPGALVPLYVSFGVMQALDMHSTRRALNGGGRESNPIMAAAVGSPLAMATMKAGTTAGIVFLTEKVRKRHPVAAVVMMVGLNSAYAMVVSHNYSVARR